MDQISLSPPSIVNRKSSVLLAALRIGLGLVFVYASLYKIDSPGAFAHSIYLYKLLPWWAINPLALVLPWWQLFAGLALIVNWAGLGAAFSLAAMLAVFQVAVASALLRGLNISCGCFKSGGEPATWLSFARDSSILLWAVVVFCWLWRAGRTVKSERGVEGTAHSV